MNFPIPQEDIISKVNSEHDESISFTQTKREIFKRRDKLYLWIDWQEDKIYVRLVYSTIDTLASLETSDERSVIFAGRKYWMEDYANNVNNVAKFDFEQMWCFRKKYQTRINKYKYWAGIEVMDKWDETLQCPEYKVISPLVRCPDWFGDVNSWPRYHWFEFTSTRDAIEVDKRYFNKDQMMSASQLSELLQAEKDNSWHNRWLDNSIILKSNDVISLYYHYTTIKGKKYLAVLSNNRSVLIRFEEIPAMTDVEKKDPSKIWFPVIVRNWRPLDNDPFGICVADLLEDKESMLQLFINLSRIKSEHQALWDMFMFDPDKVDVDSLSIPSIWPKYIPVSWLWTMQYPAMTEVPKWNMNTDEYQIQSIIRWQWDLAMWMDNQWLWLAWDKNMTATENQRVQGNQNLRVLLWIRFDNEAEKDFWIRWYKYYLFFFNKSEKKNFRLNDSVWNMYYSVSKKDFMGITDIDVEIKSKSDVEAWKEKERIGFLAVWQLVLQDQNASQSSKNFVMREMLKLNWIPSEKVNFMIRPTQEELNAYDDLELINNNESPWKIEDINEDHRTYIMIYDRALPTKAKRDAILKRRQAIKVSWQKALNIPQTQDKSMSNMMVNDMLQKQNQPQNNALSLNDVW